MNKAEKWLRDKLFGEEYTYSSSPDEIVFPIKDYAAWMREYTDEVSRELLENIIPSQKFFHALPPVAKDEYYEFVNQQEERP